MQMRNEKFLIAYFSRRGDNYVNGKIVDLPVGNTEIAARMIQELTGGDLFQIKPVKEYPAGYNDTTEVAKQELERNARPELEGGLPDLGSCEVIFLGYPNWWGTMPMPVFTFLERCNFAGKTVAPFCTHEGSGLGHSERDIARLCPGATLADGLAIQGARVKAARADIEAWLSTLVFPDARGKRR